MRERCVATAQDTRCMSLGNAPQRPAEPKRGAATAPPRRRPAARAVAAARRQAAAWAARHARRRRGRQRGAARRNARVVLRSTAAPCHDDARAAEGVVVSGRASRAALGTSLAADFVGRRAGRTSLSGALRRRYQPRVRPAPPPPHAAFSRSSRRMADEPGPAAAAAPGDSIDFSARHPLEHTWCGAVAAVTARGGC